MIPKLSLDQYYVESDFKFGFVDPPIHVSDVQLLELHSYGWRVENAGGVVFPSTRIRHISDCLIVLVLRVFWCGNQPDWRVVMSEVRAQQNHEHRSGDANRCAADARGSCYMVDHSLGNGGSSIVGHC